MLNIVLCLQNYLQEKGKSTSDFLNDCCDRITSGDFTTLGNLNKASLRRSLVCHTTVVHVDRVTPLWFLLTSLDCFASDQVRRFSPESVVCFACGLRNFKELAYQYRSTISNHKLPAVVTSRPDCYWGKNCRTQRSKAAHAA